MTASQYTDKAIQGRDEYAIVDASLDSVRAVNPDEMKKYWPPLRGHPEYPSNRT